MGENNGTQPTFEDLSKQLDEVLVLLERGDLPLEEALAAYERGVMLVRQCNDLLDRAELRITELSASVTKDASQQYSAPSMLFNLDDDDEE
jgi:exodeoxyribonuclease VII small subunit